MARSTINVGTAPNDHTGDTARAAFVKCNANFTELYELAGNAAPQSELDDHLEDTNNPHAVTKTQVGLGNVDNTSDANKPVSSAQQTALDAKASAAALSAHTADVANPHAVTKAQVGLGNCDNTSDANKPVSSAQQTALNAKADLVAGKVPSSQLPSISLVDFLGAAANQSAMLALRGDAGDFCFRSDQGLAYFITSGNGAQLSHWQAVATPGSIGVASVNGHVGVVVLDQADVGLDNVDNTSDADKPVSSAQQTALDGKADLETVTLTPAAALAFTLVFSGTGIDYVSLYVDITNNDGAVQRFWFYSATQNNPGPTTDGVTRRPIEINDSDDSDTVAAAFTGALNALAIQLAATANASTVTVTAEVARAWNDPALSGAGALALTINTHGADATTGPAVLEVQILNALQAAITDGKITLPDGRYLVVMDAP